MNVRELHRNTPNPYIVVSLSYDECRDIANALCDYLLILKEDGDENEYNRFKNIRQETGRLFSLLKNGWLYKYEFDGSDYGDE